MSLPRVPRHRSRPKLRAIPRQKSAAAAYAEMQQLAVEQQRLQQELNAIEERRLHIQERFQEIQQALATLSAEAERFGATPDPETPGSLPFSSIPSQARPGTGFSPMVIDY